MIWKFPQVKEETSLKQKSTLKQPVRLDALEQHNLCSYPGKARFGKSPVVEIPSTQY